MNPEDPHPDPELQRQYATLARDEPTSATFTDRVLRDLGHRGLVRRSVFTVDVPRLAAAAVIFAAGVGVGAVIATARPGAQPTAQPVSGNATQRVAVEVNVPQLGRSEVWF